MEVSSFESLRDQFLLCRTLKHQWDEVPGVELPKPDPGYWWFNLRCERCTAGRIDLIDSHGNMVSRHYKYPSGYMLDEKVTLSEMRQEWAKRKNYLQPRRNTGTKRRKTN